jgi:hypothetical protein
VLGAPLWGDQRLSPLCAEDQVDNNIASGMSQFLSPLPGLARFL